MSELAVNIVRLLHIVSVCMLLAGQVPLMLLMPGVATEADPKVRVSGLRMLKRLNLGLLMPGSILAGLTGFALSGMKHVPITTPWLAISLALYLAAMVLGMGVLAPWMKKLVAAAEAEAGGAPAGTFRAAATGSPLPMIARTATTVLTVALLLMMVLH